MAYADYQRVSNLYFQFGVEARRFLVREYASLHLRLRKIGMDEVTLAHHWPDRRVCWDWEQLMHNTRTEPRRIDLAIYARDTLCALALGKVSRRQRHVRLDRLESRFHNPLKGMVAVIAVRYIEVLADLVPCTTTVLVQPAQHLIEFYKDLGYHREIHSNGKLWGLSRPLISSDSVH